MFRFVGLFGHIENLATLAGYTPQVSVYKKRRVTPPQLCYTYTKNVCGGYCILKATRGQIIYQG